jgi:hypothetical protein
MTAQLMPDAQVDLDHILQGQRVPGQQSAQLAQPLRGTGCRRAHDSRRGCSFLQQNARRRGNTDSGRHRATTEISARLSGPDRSCCPGVEDGRPLTVRVPALR